MQTSRMERTQNGFGLVFLRKRISRALWLPALFLLAIAVTVKAETYGDYIYTINPNGTVRIDEYTGLDSVLNIPSDIEGRTVVGIGRYAFSSRTSLTSVTIPNSVLYLEDYVFSDCTSLASVTIGNSVNSIGFRVFNYCTNLTAITVDALNSSYSSLDGVLFNQSQTTLVQYPEGQTGDYTIPTGVNSIGKEAFMSCIRLTGVTIPDSVTSIGEAVCWGCTGLAGVTIPNSVTNIGMDAFWSCTNLAGVTIGNSVTTIGNSAFYECTSLTGVTIPASVTSIGDGAFVRCTSLTAITVDALNSTYSSLDGVLFNKIQTTLIQCPGSKVSYIIPNSVTSIGMNAFNYCTSLTGVTIGTGVTSIGGYAFEHCTSLAGVTIGNSVTSIGIDAFWGCTSLTSITIPNSVTSIVAQTFGSCTNLAEVTIGNSVSSIGDYAFSYCNNLAGVYFWGNAPSVGINVFTNANNATVYYLAVTTGWGTTFGGRPTALWNPPPLPVIRANGASGTVTVNSSEAVSISVEMNAGSYAGTDVDWWIVAQAGSSWYYLNSAIQWTSFNGILSNCHPVYQNALSNLPVTEVLNITGLSTGSYTFWFAVDYPMDGILDVDGQILVDSVIVTVQ